MPDYLIEFEQGNIPIPRHWKSQLQFAHIHILILQILPDMQPRASEQDL